MTRTLFALLMVSFFTAAPVFAGGALPAAPRLTVVLVIDQFRADTLMRFKDRFLPALASDGIGGFRYLLEKGAYFPYAEYDLLQNMTGPGHATVLSGSLASMMGVPGNVWFDAKEGRKVYCAEDSSSPLVASSGLISGRNASEGRSPKNFWGSTVGDELKNASRSSSVISIALKDRSAIFLGGKRATLALWMDPSLLEWVSSRYYVPEGKSLPTWVMKANQNLKGLTKSALATKRGVELTVDLALEAIDGFELGKKSDHTDLLAISLSTHDYVGHEYGPNSAETESISIAEDAEVSRLLRGLQKKLPGGLTSVVFALTADHGVAPSPEWLMSEEKARPKHSFEAGKISETLLRKGLESTLTQKFGSLRGEWIGFAKELNFYFSPAAIKGRSPSELKALQTEAAQYLTNQTGVLRVIRKADVEDRTLPGGLLERQILASYVAGRSGDLIVIPKPYFIHDDGDGAGHVTGYSYDRMVPLVMMGAGIKPGTYLTKTRVIDLAPTLAALLHILPPAQAEGRVLDEALAEKPRLFTPPSR